jgi:hypothetical protein
MNNRLTNIFTYLKSHNDYTLASNKLKSIIRPNFEYIPSYYLIEDTFIDFLIPAIHYYDDNENVSHINSILTKLTDCPGIEQKSFEKRNKPFITEILKEINTIKNDFKCLKYYNHSGFEPKNQDNFSKKVYKFMEDIGIWKLEYEDGWDEEQNEWDPEFFEMLNIAYHCNSLEELNDVYKMVWFFWLFEIFPKGIHPNAKIIWENLSYWKNIIDNELTENVLQNKPKEVQPELYEPDDSLSMEENLEAYKRKFSK